MTSQRWLSSIKSIAPSQALILYYLASILLGALLLASPWAAHGGPLPFLDALFTATSAQCVTGLTVVDTGTRLTLFGQLVVLSLMQLGGVGIITFSVYLFVYLKIGISARDRWTIQETLAPMPVSSVKDLVKGIFLFTLAVEAVGAGLLAVAFIPKLGWSQGLYSALFHAVSAFCNAGFSLYPDSLIGYRADSLVNLTVILLVMVGGIGFPVIGELGLAWKRRMRGQRGVFRLSLHSKLALITTSILIVAGVLAILWLEAGHSLAKMNWLEGFWAALFQSVVARTAGFNTMDMNALRAPTLAVMIFLMFIGGSPGSTAGGIKTTSLALLYGVVYNRLKGSPHTSFFRRTIPEEAVTKVLAFVLLAVVIVGVALFCLLAVHDPSHEQNPRNFLDITFETFSAFSTVGLSMGATSRLSPEGKWIIVALMFVGRVGLLTVAFAIAGRTRPNAGRYPEENIMIG